VGSHHPAVYWPHHRLVYLNTLSKPAIPPADMFAFQPVQKCSEISIRNIVVSACDDMNIRPANIQHGYYLEESVFFLLLRSIR
jgi:hypothetical protein